MEAHSAEMAYAKFNLLKVFKQTCEKKLVTAIESRRDSIADRLEAKSHQCHPKIKLQRFDSN